MRIFYQAKFECYEIKSPRSNGALFYKHVWLCEVIFYFETQSKDSFLKIYEEYI